MILAISDWAYVAGAVAVPVGTVFVAWITLRSRIESIHAEVKSPNGTKTGEVTYENRKTLIELREQMAEIREAQLDGWRRAREDTAAAEASRERLETTVNEIASAQAEHLGRDEERFGVLFGHLNLNDPSR